MPRNYSLPVKGAYVHLPAREMLYGAANQHQYGFKNPNLYLTDRINRLMLIAYRD